MTSASDLRETDYLDLIEEATALWESLAQNHPLIDGNKRTAFAATYTFLAINGASITADAQAAQQKNHIHRRSQRTRRQYLRWKSADAWNNLSKGTQVGDVSQRWVPLCDLCDLLKMFLSVSVFDYLCPDSN